MRERVQAWIGQEVIVVFPFLVDDMQSSWTGTLVDADGFGLVLTRPDSWYAGDDEQQDLPMRVEGTRTNLIPWGSIASLSRRERGDQ